MTFEVREPVLHSTPIDSLRPTQMTVGMREVAQKRQAWRKYDPTRPFGVKRKEF